MKTNILNKVIVLAGLVQFIAPGYSSENVNYEQLSTSQSIMKNNRCQQHPNRQRRCLNVRYYPLQNSEAFENMYQRVLMDARPVCTDYVSNQVLNWLSTIANEIRDIPNTFRNTFENTSEVADSITSCVSRIRAFDFDSEWERGICIGRYACEMIFYLENNGYYNPYA